jgi:hypothetical protein
MSKYRRGLQKEASDMADEVTLDQIRQVRDELRNSEAKSTEAPKKLLEGRVEFTPEMEKTDKANAKLLLPQKEDNPAYAAFKTVMALPDAAGQGISEVPEDLTNFALGAGQSLANVPQQNRVTVADLVRKLLPGYVSPGEQNRGPAMAAGLAQNPAVGVASAVGNFAGGMMFPLGGVEAAGLNAAKAGLKFIPGAIPAIQHLAQPVRQLAQTSKGAAVLNALKYAPKMNIGFGKLSVPAGPMLHGAATGAAYAPVFTGGQTFGQTRQMPTGQQIRASMALGGGLGAGMGGAMGAVQRYLLASKISKMAKMSQLAEEQNNKPAVALKSIMPLPVLQEKMNSGILKAVAANYERTGGDPAPLKQLGRTLIPALHAHYDPLGPKYTAAIDAADSLLQKHVVQRASVKARDAFSEQKALENRQRMDAKEQQKKQEAAQKEQQKKQEAEQKLKGSVEKTAEHTMTSGDRFEDLSDRIGRARSKDDLSSFRNEIFNPGVGPKGQRLLDTGHQMELDRQWRKAYARFHRAKGGKPGESQAAPSSSETPPLESQSSKTSLKGEITIDEGEQKPGGVRDFLIGTFRKVINKKSYGPRENRYKFAVSVDALAKAAGLPQDKTTALKKWVADLSAAARERTICRQRANRLCEWAMTHEDEWVGSLGNVKLSRRTDIKTENEANDVLSRINGNGNLDRLILKARMENSFEEATNSNLEGVPVNNKRSGETGIRLKKLSNATVEVTTNGSVEKDAWRENLDGSLKLKEIGKVKLDEFVPPKSADDLFNQLHQQLTWHDIYDEDIADIKAGEAPYNYLEGHTAKSVMQEAFDALKLPYLEGKAPDTIVWHIDEADHVSTVAFKQERTRSLDDLHAEVDNAQEDAQKFVEGLADKDGNIKYEALWGNVANMSKLLSYFPGAEIPVLGMLLAKPTLKAGDIIGNLTHTDVIFAGALDNIFRHEGSARFDGELVSQSFHTMVGDINRNFFKDMAGQYVHPQSAEDLAELLNEFKGEEIDQANYRHRAVNDAYEKLHKDGIAMMPEDIAEANKRADTALMIRAKYQALAQDVAARIKEMEIRETDAKSGVLSPEGKQFMVGGIDYDNTTGKVYRGAYSRIYHQALTELHKGLTLQPTQYSHPADAVMNLYASRVSKSIMANNPVVGLRNFFDQAPVTIAYYGHHFFTAVLDLAVNAEARDAVLRMPSVPQSDMSHLQLQEQLKDTRPPENIGQHIQQYALKVEDFIQKIDPLFKGTTPLVSMADRHIFGPASVLASFYKQAHEAGVPRHEFMENLMNGKYDEKKTSGIFAQVSLDVSKNTNSWAPHLNQDMFANSTVGKLMNAYSTPSRRNTKTIEGWARSDDPVDKARIVSVAMQSVALAGAGAIPASALLAYKAWAFLNGQNEQAQKNINFIDQRNILRAATGIDYSNNFSSDYASGAAPAIDKVGRIYGAMKSAAQSAPSTEAALLAAAGVALDSAAIFPKIGPLGWESWKRGLKVTEAAGEGTRKVYYKIGDTLSHVMINDYNYHDAMRDWLIGGINPKAKPLIQEAEMNAAIKADAKFWANKSIIPERSNASEPKLPLLGLPIEKQL